MRSCRKYNGYQVCQTHIRPLRSHENSPGAYVAPTFRQPTTMPPFHPFRRLPPALRNRIYFFTLIDNNPSLLLTSRQVRHEALRHPHRNVTYRLTLRYSYSAEGERRVAGIDLHISLLRPAPLRFSDVEDIFLRTGLRQYRDCNVTVDFGARRATRSISVDLADLRDFRCFWSSMFWTLFWVEAMVRPCLNSHSLSKRNYGAQSHL